MQPNFDDPIDRIKKTVASIGGSAVLDSNTSNNKTGVCAGLCDEFLNAVRNSGGEFNPLAIKEMVDTVMRASRNKSGTQRRANMEDNTNVKDHPYYKRLDTVRTLAQHYDKLGYDQLADDYTRLAELYLEALTYDHGKVGYIAQAEGQADVNILNGINKLPRPGQMLVSIWWEGGDTGHAIAVAKDRKGDIVIYDPNIGIVGLPDGIDNIKLTDIVVACMDFNRKLYKGKMSAKVKPLLRDQSEILIEIATLEAQARNKESFIFPARPFNPVYLSAIKKASGSADINQALLNFRNQVKSLDADHFYTALMKLGAACRAKNKENDERKAQLLWTAATTAFASIAVEPLNDAKLDELVNTAMQSQSVSDVLKQEPIGTELNATISQPYIAMK